MLTFLFLSLFSLLLFSGVAFAQAPAYTLTRIDLPFMGVADFLTDRLQNVSGDLFLSVEGVRDALKGDERFRDLSDRLKDNPRFQRWRDRFRDLRESLLPEDGRIRLVFRQLRPETYRDEDGLHFVFAVDVDALKALAKERIASGDRAKGRERSLLLHIIFRVGENEDWAATLTPSAYVEWNGQGRTFEVPEGIFLDKLREYARSAEALLNNRLDMKALRRHIPLRDDTVSGDATPDSLTRRTVNPWIRKLWGAMLTGYPEAYRVEYDTTEAHGRTIRASGAIVFPFASSADLTRVPILSIQHPTLVERRYSPSEFQAGLKDPAASQFFAYLALMAASNGYLVVAADYPGLGVSTEPHPFCHASLAVSVVDAIRVAHSVVDEKLAPEGKRWKGQTYLVGYSEGGYASMVAARKLQEDGPPDLFPSGVACLSGPYSLSAAMRLAMATPVRDYATPYLLPMLLAAYDAIYPGKGFAFDAAIRRDVPGFANFPADLRSLIDGVRTEAEINALVGDVPGYPEKGPSALMTPDFLERLRDPDSEIARLLAENDAHRGWVPKMPMKLFHNTKDATVPATNTTTAFAAFEAAGANVKSVQIELFDDLVPATGNTHVDASAPSFLKGMLWLHSLRDGK